jgi:hypothetical protein
MKEQARPFVLGCVFWIACALCVTQCGTQRKGSSPIPASSSPADARVHELEARVEGLERARAELRALLAGPKTPALWEIAEDERTGQWLPRPVRLFPANATARVIADAINERHPRPNAPGITVERVENGVAYVRIHDGELFTQRMGSTGAMHYAAMIIFSLTSLDDISHVSLRGFEAGDHAAPGCYSRGDWLSAFGLLDGTRGER